MTKTVFTVLSALLIAAGQQPPSTVAKVERVTFTDAVLARDTWNMILRSEAMIELMQNSAEARCQERALSRTRIAELPQKVRYKEDGTITDGSWKEEWVVDRCGKLFSYTIQFNAVRGGTRIGVEHPFNPTPVPR
jgi:hypothetical protein